MTTPRSFESARDDLAQAAVLIGHAGGMLSSGGGPVALCLLGLAPHRRWARGLLYAQLFVTSLLGAAALAVGLATLQPLAMLAGTYALSFGGWHLHVIRRALSVYDDAPRSKVRPETRG